MNIDRNEQAPMRRIFATDAYIKAIFQPWFYVHSAHGSFKNLSWDCKARNVSKWFFFFSVEKLIFTALVDNSVLFWHQLHRAHFTPWSVQISLTRKALNLMTEWQNKTFPEQNSHRMLPYTTSYFLIALAKQQPKTMPTTSMKQMMMPVTPTYTIFSLNFSRSTSIQFLW